jgi:hypothetical protein
MMVEDATKNRINFVQSLVEDFFSQVFRIYEWFSTFVFDFFS